MRRLAFALLLAASTAALAVPALEARSESGVTLSVPQGWKALITADERSVTMSRDAFNQIILKWYPWKDGVSKDQVIDLLISATNKSLKVGSFAEARRTEILGGRGRMATGTWTGPLGYEMKMGFSVVLDSAQQRIVSGVFLASPEGWTELGGGDLLVGVSGGLSQAP